MNLQEETINRRVHKIYIHTRLLNFYSMSFCQKTHTHSPLYDLQTASALVCTSKADQTHTFYIQHNHKLNRNFYKENTKE